ncbi:MAG: hypothetical protein R6X29_07540 [Acidimicrobiia bacterium]|jgi:hypothetical protein
MVPRRHRRGTAYLERLQAAKGEVAQEPANQPFEVGDCAAGNPTGNLIRIQESHHG